jgi:hypothetical protein
MPSIFSDKDKVVVEILFNTDLSHLLEIKAQLLSKGISYELTGVKGIADAYHVFNGKKVRAFGPYTSGGAPLEGVATFDVAVQKYKVDFGNGSAGWYLPHDLELVEVV